MELIRLRLLARGCGWCQEIPEPVPQDKSARQDTNTSSAERIADKMFQVADPLQGDKWDGRRKTAAPARIESGKSNSQRGRRCHMPRGEALECSISQKGESLSLQDVKQTLE